MIDLSVLRTEFQNNPKNLPYAPLLAVGNTTAVADLLNARTGPGAEVVQLQVIPKGDFLLGIAPAALVLASKDAATQAKWDRLIALASAADMIRIGNSTIQQLLGLAISEGILTQPQVDAFTKRMGSRAEVLYEPGVVASNIDVAQALAGGV